MGGVFRALTLGALLAATAAGAQTVYKSTNPDGSVVYSDRPPADGKIDKVIVFEDLPSSPVAPLAVPSHPPSRPPRTNAVRPPPPPVTLYSAVWCGYCKRAKAYLADHRIAYLNVDIDTADGRAEFDDVGGGGVPLLKSGRKKVRGFKAEGYDAFFARR